MLTLINRKLLDESEGRTENHFEVNHLIVKRVVFQVTQVEKVNLYDRAVNQFIPPILSF